MVNLILGGIDVGTWVTGYVVDVRPVSEDAGSGSDRFLDANGNYTSNKAGNEVVLNITLEEFPENVSVSLANALQAETVNVSYTTPSLMRNNFYLDSYKAECEGGNPENIWTVRITLRSAELINSGGDGL